MNTAGIVFLSLGILFILVPIIIAVIVRKYDIIALSLTSALWFMFFSLVNYPDPTKEDVKDGKAIYIEEVNVGLNSSGDTIYNYSTYNIEWLPEWKYGRKQK